MSALRLVALSGNIHRPSKTRALAEAAVAAAARRRPFAPEIYDLVDIGPGVGAFSRRELPQAGRDVLDAIENADALIIATPVYKGSYIGLLKHLIDFIDPQALVGRPVLLGATGGGHRHALVVEHQLRPLFGFFSALATPTAVYASDADFADGALVAADVRARLDQAADELVHLAEARRHALARAGDEARRVA
ncbi:FMN reductase [Camelimonas abortus]|uniref:FMN reductase n=1 Tax=Camelimonas abortus TaxID=1017184 RepID=A0ABV7LDF0_9HYPH